MRILSAILIFSIMLTTCSPSEKTETPDIDQIAKDYVKLVLEVGQHDSDFVDAYYGPEDLKPTGDREESAAFPSGDYLVRADDLRSQLDAVDASTFEGLEKSRLNMLKKQLLAVRTKIGMMGGEKYSFDEEAKLLYDAEPPTYSQDYFDSLLAGLDKVLPGTGNVSERYTAYAKDFIIPKDKLDAVFQTAITEARKRTDGEFQLPENENFVLEYVNDKSWSGYNYYQGKSQSLIQLNTDFPIFIERAIDLACHEGYPGHHVFNALLEQNLVDGKGWVEFSVYPLFSPQSLIAEGSANYGIDVAFPGETRLAYEKEVLFPIAGIDPTKADRYYEIQALRSKLNYAGNEAARKYLNGEISREEAASWLEKYLLYEPDRALQRTRFIDQYRSYVINYNLGKDLVANYVENQGGTADQPAKRWAAFKELLSNPHTASTLK